MPYYDIGGGVTKDLPGSDADALTYNSPTYRDYKGVCPTCSTVTPRYHAGFPRPSHCWRCLGDVFMNHLQRTRSARSTVRVTSPTPCKGGPHLVVHGSDSKRCLVCRDISIVRRGKKATLTGSLPPKHHPMPTPDGVNAHEKALIYDQEWFIPDFRCDKCETFAVRHVEHVEWCQGCWSTKWDESVLTTPRQVAQAAKETWYTPDTPCNICDTVSQRRVNDGRCRGCYPTGERLHSPERQAAVEAGERWYTPSKPHSKCGLIADRYVANGRCKGCAAVGEVEKALMEAGELPKETAIAIGAKIYTDSDGSWRLI